MNDRSQDIESDRTIVKLLLVKDKTYYVKSSGRKKCEKRDLGDKFIAPDGGWGWLVATASGVSLLVTVAITQQFGLIFRDYMITLGITSSQLTTIINVQIAASSFSGLLNGPLFRRLSYRQVALIGSFLMFFGLFTSTFADSFIFYILSYSCCYGLGRGLTLSASSLAVNTYFKKKRCTATAYQFGVSGIGPICLPYLTTYLLECYGVKGTVLLFAGFALNSIPCSLVYQPVKWHIKRTFVNMELKETVEQPTFVLSRARSNCFRSCPSLPMISYKNSTNGADKLAVESDLQSLKNSKSNYKKAFTTSLSDITKGKTIAQTVGKLKQKRDEKKPWHSVYYRKIIAFFDLDLLRDFSYVNLAVGLTLIKFVEVNFTILTPFILADFGFANSEIAIAMSSLGISDLIIRFLIPLITAKMNYNNKTFVIGGVLGMCLGRAILSFTHNFYVMLTIFLWFGLNRAFRLVFWCLIIPAHVPLKRLPAASGLQLLMTGLFSFAFGPLIGLIRDNTSYAVTLNCLNALCLLAILLWMLEDVVRRFKLKKKSKLKSVMDTLQ
uniref:Major facilitator superfamily (MFS) profile domain-containing protein n=1 Tax=Glossina morsitans morsitans TaxID=37546 RepID=A0A1B0G2T3_GLOMM